MTKIVHSLTINHRTFEAMIDASTTLLETLRYKLDLIGTKQGCDKGDCGACTVLIDNEPHLSCLTLAARIDKHQHITTIEGLATKEALDVLIEAFDQCGALQCGFCQPGMILSAKALLMKNKTPSHNEIREALSGNLCRCTGYTKIYQAIEAASLVLSNKVDTLDQAIKGTNYIGE